MSVTTVRVKFLLIVALGVLSVTVVRAETARDTLEQFGFFGTWAAHCGEPASPENVTRYARGSKSMALKFSETLGKDSEPNVYAVLSAERLSPDTVVIRTKLNDDIEQELTIRRDQDRVRTMENREVAGGEYVVKNGLVTSNKSETPWLTRCSDEPRSQ
jgi:hypothetical protein